MNGTTIRRAAAAALALTISAIMLAACGGSSEPEDLTFAIEIKGMKWNLDSDEIKVRQGDSVSLEIRTDLDGYLHVHGYDFVADVTVDTPGALSFLANATGRFSIMYHVAGPDPEQEEGHQGDEHTEEVSEFLLGALEVRPR